MLGAIDGARVTDNIWGERWSKLASNASSNPVTAMTGLGSSGAATHSSARWIQVHIAKEAVRVGQALAHAAGTSLTVVTGQRAQIPNRATPAAPVGPLPIPRDVLRNGSLQDGVPGPAGQPGRPSHWTVLDLSEREPPGRVSWEIEAGQGKVAFERVGEGHGETIIRQAVGRDLSDTASVLLAAEVRVDSHSLSGGGFAGTEYPLMLRVVYEDINRTKTVWVHGFFVHNRDELPVREATAVRAGEWSSYEVNLLQLVPRPAQIERLEVLAAGWSYRSAVRNVRLVID